ncbi:cytochrome oxidase complex assembly protein 1-domain-containing protein [Mycena amicta]|nr:cytochrome oxidase complex assembly protein 1-domain-containing protein [Mycena amicta]
MLRLVRPRLAFRRPLVRPTRIRYLTEGFQHDKSTLYSNFKSHRDLPRIERRWPMVLGVTAVVFAGWAAFLTYVTNETKCTSSVVKQIVRTLKADSQLRDSLGLAIRPQPEWWLNGYPIIHGQINQLQGNIDVSFRIKGSAGSGTVYFTSVRKAKGIPYELLRFRVILDNGQVVEVQPASDSGEE